MISWRSPQELEPIRSCDRLMILIGLYIILGIIMISLLSFDVYDFYLYERLIQREEDERRERERAQQEIQREMDDWDEEFRRLALFSPLYYSVSTTVQRSGNDENTSENL